MPKAERAFDAKATGAAARPTSNDFENPRWIFGEPGTPGSVRRCAPNAAFEPSTRHAV